MLKNNFRFILLKEKETISRVSRGTGISRTTLTNLYYQRSKGLSLEVLEKICAYLNCSVNDILEYHATVKMKKEGVN